MEQKKKVRIAIIVLAVLLAFSLIALGGTLLYNKLANSNPATVTVPDNLITPEEAESSENPTTSAETLPSESASAETKDSVDPNDTENGDNVDGSESVPSADVTRESEKSVTSALTKGQDSGEKKAVAIDLYNKQPEDNTAFQVGNMFPGDAETKYFCVRVSYHDEITVHYKADVRPGYEKLAEVLKIRVRLLSTGETLYDGLMSEMPRSVKHKMTSRDSVTDELYYEITAYLDTSVGNEYQNRDLIADFSWWVEETGHLDPPQTGDAPVLLWAVLAAFSGCLFILLLFVRRREEDEENG